MFLHHRILSPIFKNSDFLKLSLKNQQGFFVEIPPRDARNLKKEPQIKVQPWNLNALVI